MEHSATPDVSIIIPVYNGEKYLQATIQSVLSQTYKNFEIIIVDDGSTDKTSLVINDLLTADSRIRKLHQLNKGVSAARNLGFKNSMGEFIAFLDSDDIWLPDNLTLKKAKLNNNDWGLVHSNALVINDDKLTNKMLRGCEGYLLNDLLFWQSTQIPGPSSILVKREVLNTIGVFDESLSTSADQDFFIRVAAKYKIGMIDQVTWYYRTHDSNMHKNIRNMEQDVLKVFKNAKDRKLFHNRTFERHCFANMYLILSASWAGDGKKPKRAFLFLFKAIRLRPSVIFKLLLRLFKKV